MIIILEAIMAVDIALPVRIEITKERAKGLGVNPCINIGNDPTTDGPETVLAFIENGVHVQSSLYLKIFCHVKVKERDKNRTPVTPFR
jgi:hypothetical protein